MRSGLWVGALMALVGVSACNIQATGSSGITVTLSVTLGGKTDCDGGAVDKIRATAPNGGLPQLLVPCKAGGPVLLTYNNVSPGTYELLVEGRVPTTGDETTKWSSRQEISVTEAGTHEYSFDLAQQGAEAVFDFAFVGADPKPFTCAQAGVTSLHIVIDEGSATATQATVTCHDQPTNTDRGAVTGIQPGSHTFHVSALDSAGKATWDAVIPNEMVYLDMQNEFTVNLQPAQKGTLQVQWSFTDPSMTGLCDGAGVQQVSYALTNPDGSPGPTGTVPCAVSPTMNGNATIDNLNAGTYTISSIRGLDANGNAVYGSAMNEGLLVLPGQTKAYLVTMGPLAPN